MIDIIDYQDEDKIVENIKNALTTNGVFYLKDAPE